MPEDKFAVYLYEHRVGTLHRRGNYTRFAFDATYVNDPHRPVLGLRFEDNLQAKCAANMRLPSWFSNLLPEGTLREWVASAGNISVERETDLLVHLGSDLPGAVRILADDFIGSAESVREDDNSRYDEAIVRPAKWRFSLAGVALKFSMLRQGERFTAPAFGEAGDWIIKLPDQIHAQVPTNEFAMMMLAKSVGIEVPEVRLVHRDQIESLPEDVWCRGETLAYAIKRFDRGPERQLIHIEDFAQVRGFYPQDKYLGSYETVAAIAYRNRDLSSLIECVRRLAFNIMIGNGDAHLKNWSLIYRDRRVPSLAPAYDLVSTVFYRPSHFGPEEMGLRLGGTRRFEGARLHQFRTLDVRIGANADLAEVVKSVIDAVLDAWPLAAQLLNDDSMRRQIGDFVHQRAATLLQ